MNINTVLLTLNLLVVSAIGIQIMTLGEALQANLQAISNLSAQVDAVPAKIVAAGDMAPAIQAINDSTAAIQAQADKLAGM